MKNITVSTILTATLCVLVLLLAGCCGYFSQPGETEAEGHMRHLRNLRINQQELIGDIDRALLMDEPAKSTPIKID